MTTCSVCYPRDCGQAEGERRKDAAIGLLAIHREAWVRKIQRDFVRVLLQKGEATSDEVSDNTPLAVRKSCLGAAVNHLSRASVIKFVRFTISARPDRHACPTRVWRIADRGKALRWLSAHPDLPDPLDADQGERATVQTTMF